MFQSATEQLAALRRGDVSSVELTRDYLARIERLNERLGAFVTVDADAATRSAAQADEARSAGVGGVLCGLPVALKDLFCVAGTRTTCASKMLADFVAPYDATVAERLNASGAVMLGKTNMDEFAMGSSNETSHFGAAVNPWDPQRVPGGSSGGSAVAVAAGLCSAAVGTDTGGSIRQPAGFCGITGLKPTYGSIPRFGMVAFASSLDQAGPMTRSAEDAALLYHVLAGFDPRDSTSSRHNGTWLDTPDQELPEAAHVPLTIGVPAEYSAVLSEASAAILERTIKQFEQLGATVREVSLPHTDSAIPAYYVISGAEASTNLSRYDGVRFGHRANDCDSIEQLVSASRTEGFGAEVKRRILTGTYALSVGYYDAYYLKAMRLRRLIQQDFLTAFDEVDLILTPTTPGPAFQLGAVADPVEMYRQDVFTVPASLAGLPAVSFPAGTIEALPVGAQLIAPPFAEQRLLEAAHAFQQNTDHHLNTPKLAQ